MATQLSWRSRTLPAVAVAALVTAALGTNPAAAAPSAAPHGPAGIVNHLTKHHVRALDTTNGNSHDSGDETPDLMDAAAQYTEIRNAPGVEAVPQAYYSGQQQGQRLPNIPGPWKELTNQPYNSDALDYRDPNWSNSTGGSGYVAGRVSALASDGARTVYVGAADGGVWRSDNGGNDWQPLWDSMPSLAIGAIAVDPADHSVWVGTGESDFSADSLAGNAIYHSTDRGRTWQQVGQSYFGLRSARIALDGAGHVYAATNQGLLRHDLGDLTTPWTTVLAPAAGAAASFATDVRVLPGSNGGTVATVIVNGGLRAGSQNGFYLSTTGGGAGTYQQVTATGDLANGDIGRTTFTWNANASALFAVVQSSANSGTLSGVYRADSGVPSGPWTRIASTPSLVAAGAQGCGGCQGWYDQYVTADPVDPNHVYLGLEDVYETSDRGASWQVIGPYWNFSLPCWNADPAKITCPGTTHADQHAVTVTSDGTAYFGNDGGVYSRPTSLRGVVKWDNHNKGLHTLQYYSVGIGKVAGGDAVWGGLQDNGVSLLLPGAKEQVSPFGGDGGQVIVDPRNGNRAVNEYVHLAMARTENGGKSDNATPSYTTDTPSCDDPVPGTVANPCDPSTLFIAPYSADINNTDHWVAGGRYVWDNQGKGWNSTCGPTACDWKNVHDTGAQVTAVVAKGDTVYAAWRLRDPTGVYHSGIDTNFGGSWHRLPGANLPSRYITSISLDPYRDGHLFVSFGGYTDTWVPGAGRGHVFESADGGASWSDSTGNLPDLPTTSVVQWHGLLVAATDGGVFLSSAWLPGLWFRLGSKLPSASGQQLTVSPDGRYLALATHGRGIWTWGLKD
ncbi:glycosyl hydrolase [Solihabitans fulvus]|uniref:glycosyl hydrolase n=1 Tax=Solihabitans fulvus TaxID=1892852 RepID=UPI0016620F2C|nr:glycosyl hydrolase [Solihabitans fulvus]